MMNLTTDTTSSSGDSNKSVKQRRRLKDVYEFCRKYKLVNSNNLSSGPTYLNAAGLSSLDFVFR